MITFFSESEIPEVKSQLDALKIEYESSQLSCFSVGAGTFAVLCLQYGFLPAASGIIGAWMMAVKNRRVRIRMGQNEYEAGNIKELEQLIAISQKLETTKGDAIEGPPLKNTRPIKELKLSPDSSKAIEP